MTTTTPTPTPTFDVLVVTSPDSTAAKATEDGPLQELFDTATTTGASPRLLSTHDPYDTRCGSGGGTLAAMMKALNSSTESSTESSTTAATTTANTAESILIIHAGGESSRCPTQMVLGKSWTTLPCSTTATATTNNDNHSNNKIQSPTSLMVHRLMDLLVGLPKGSVVVAASDTLLKLGDDSIPTIDWSGKLDAVIGVAVPAPLETATNHGVYVLASNDNHNDNDNSTSIQPVHDFLQKPSIETLQKTPNASFGNNKDAAWIDTGIVIFPPRAARALRDLAENELACCCWDGLRDMHEENDPSSSSLHDFAQDHAQKVELYTHLLMALSNTRTTTTTLQDYLKRHSDLPPHLLTAIYTRLSPFSLQTLIVPQGLFLHLGTSKELVQFLVDGSGGSGCNNRSAVMGKDLQLVRTYNSILSSKNNHNTTAVSYNSLIQTTKDSNLSIGDGTVLEHVRVSSASDISIGKGCLISGWRGEYTTKSSNIVLTDKTCLQVMPLASIEEDTQSFVVMMFGLEDDIKGWATVHGVDVTTFLHETALTNLWATGTTKKLLWTAQLHPIVNEVDIPKLFSWVQALQETGRIADKRLLEYYKSCRRVSLQSIRKISDAQAEWNYRFNLERIVIPLHQNLMNRHHVECKLGTNAEATLSALSTISWKALYDEEFDVAGRAFMVASALCADVCEEPATKISSQDLQTIVDEFRTSNDAALSNKLFQFGLVNGTKLAEMSLAFELVASVMTERCVMGVTPSLKRSTGTIIPLNTWVVSTAPVRVDLSGGWSDTPPICYEYGGAVAGLAVTVDGCKPLSCRSRIVPGGDGIRLVNESRDSDSGKLLNSVTTTLRTVADLKDCRDPMASCALIKCALVYLGLIVVDPKSTPNDQLQPLLLTFCNRPQLIGLEIISTSLLPRGSGMGTSSILAGCVLASIARCVGINLTNTDDDDDDSLIYHVLALEQLLTCGGGWQDQIGGLVGGLKLGTSPKLVFPVMAKVQRIPISESTIATLNERLILVFTGHTRLAKNLLQNVLRRWARRTPEIVQTVEALVRDANRVVTMGATIDDIALCLNNYWAQKKIMAGDDCEPPVVKFVLTELMKRNEIVAGSLCGAGGGGFMVLVAAKGQTLASIQSTCENELVTMDANVAKFTWHSCEVSMDGLSTTATAVQTTTTTTDSDTFDMNWHKTVASSGEPVEKKPRL